MTFSDRFHERLSRLSLPRPLSTYSHGPPPCAKIAIVMTKQSGLSRLMPLSSALHHWWCYHNPCCRGNSLLREWWSLRWTIWILHFDLWLIYLLIWLSLISLQCKAHWFVYQHQVRLNNLLTWLSRVSTLQGGNHTFKLWKTRQLWESPNCLIDLRVYTNVCYLR